MTRLVPALGVLVVGAILAVATWRVVVLEESEVAHTSSPRLLEPTPSEGATPEPRCELARVELRQGALATFEVCAGDSLKPELWADAVDFGVRHAESSREVVSLPLTEGVLAYATRGEGAACLLLAFDEPIAESGVHVVEASWEGRELPEPISAVPVLARVMAHASLANIDRLLVAALVLAALLSILGAVRWRRDFRDVADTLDGESPQADVPAPELRLPLLRAGVGLALLLVAALGVGLIPVTGAASGLLQGVTLAVLQIVLALVLVHGARAAVGGRAAALALCRPRRAAWLLWLAPIAGGALWLVGDQLQGIVPATSEAPIQTFVSSPGGMLAVAALAAAVPLAEEVFFRGFLFGALAQRFGGPVAFGATVVLFSLAHLAQAWGAWGALCSIVVVGVVLTALRWWTGSVVVPAVAHLAHNGMIVYFTIAAAT